MQSKRDQVQAHSFMMSRLTVGMLLADPDAPDNPLARTTRGFLMGLVAAVLIGAGAGVYGLMSPGGQASWRSPGSFVINRDTGSRYLFLGGRLRPVRNYASAKLLGGAGLKTSSVGGASLQTTPVGLPVGIPGAPDSLPAVDKLDNDIWQVCSSVGVGSTQAAYPKASKARTVLNVGDAGDYEGLAAGRALVVNGPDGAQYLVWQGSRLKLDGKTGAAVSLGYGSLAPRPVSAAFLDALVAGPTLMPPAVPGRGDTGPQLAGHKSTVGQVFRVEVPGSAAHYYLLQRNGLVPLTDTLAALALGDPQTRNKAYGGHSPSAVGIGADALKQHMASSSGALTPRTDGLPPAPPEAVTVPSDSVACARTELNARGETRVTTVLRKENSLASAAQVDATDVQQACMRVDSIRVQAGHGALVRALAASGANVGDTTYLVGDTGAKYRVPTAEALTALGYEQTQVSAIPSTLLAMLPTGPDLDPRAASGLVKPRASSADCGSRLKEKGGVAVKKVGLTPALGTSG
ncbi:type VII secretion protein EccB [Streptomyces sp. NPDC059215]|uniref:type VII secretion protein EccB n=1 Tax=Streptomyces sp. NPDC059215 TaxID=3346772 RepID=UPI0036A1D4B6